MPSESLIELRRNNPYKIFSDRSYMDLSKKVNEYIEEGYEPLGGVCYSDYLNRFFQAMIYKK